MQNTIDRSPRTWAYKRLPSFIPANACFNSVSPESAAAVVAEVALRESQYGSVLASIRPEFGNDKIQGGYRSEIAQLLGVKKENVSLFGCTESAVKFLAEHTHRIVEASHPGIAKPSVIALSSDYPSLFLPFANLQNAQLHFIEPETDSAGRPIRWSVDTLDKKLEHTEAKMVVISEVLFGSGFRINLEELHAVCKDRGARLILDIAQCVGARSLAPILPQVDAAVFPCWKGLMALRGVAAMYTSPEMTKILIGSVRANEAVTRIASASGMTDIDAEDARAFQPSTLPTALIAGASHTLREHGMLKYGSQLVDLEVANLQLTVLENVDRKLAVPVLNEGEGNGLILSFRLTTHEGREKEVAAEAERRGLILTTRQGMVRFGLHICNSQDEAKGAARIFNEILSAR